MFSFSSSPSLQHRPVYCRRQEPEFGFYNPSWPSCSDGRFIFGNHGRRSVPTFFLIDQFVVNDQKTGTKQQRKNNACKKTEATCCHHRRQGGERFHVELDLKDFKPEEIDLSLDADRLKIHAKSEKRRGVTSEVFKWYSLPANIDIDKLTSSLSRNGTLQVNAPFKTVAPAATDENSTKDSPESDEPMERADGEKTNVEEEDVINGPSGTITSGDVTPLETDGTEFHIELPMEQFKPEHVHVSVEELRLKVHAKKVDKSDGNFVQEEVTKWFSLPSDIDVNQLRSNIRDDGVLVINAPLGAIALTSSNTAESSANEVDDTQDMTTDDNIITDYAQKEDIKQ